jgi:menaquinone-specific isochorismate synthase
VTSAGKLVCVTRAADMDPGAPPAGARVTAFRSPRRELWGLGEALRIELPAPWPDHVGLVGEALAAIERDDEVDSPGSGPVAFGALPFDRRAPASLVVPRVVFGRTAEGARWTTTVAPRGVGVDVDVAAEQGADGEPPGELAVRSVRPPELWCTSVAQATDRIRAGDLTKVVLARELSVTTDRPIDAGALLGRLRAAYPAALCFAVDGFVGASPELLVSRVGDIVRAQPMAGTTARTGEPETDQRRAAELLSSDKNRVEHQITVDMVHDTLLPWCSFLDSEPTPAVVAAGPVQHLASIVEGRLSRPAAAVLDLVAALHPTPAVGGWPRDAALALIDELEDAGRGRYAGPVGWTDAAGNGAWAVGIRAVELDGTTARVFAGVGVVADSDPLAELEETRSKAQAMLGAIVRL